MSILIKKQPVSFNACELGSIPPEPTQIRLSKGRKSVKCFVSVRTQVYSVPGTAAATLSVSDNIFCPFRLATLGWTKEAPAFRLPENTGRYGDSRCFQPVETPVLGQSAGGLIQQGLKDMSVKLTSLWPSDKATSVQAVAPGQSRHSPTQTFSWLL